jgi:molybdate transport repressor ModE-like protein/molybdopterin-binding protein
MFGFDDRTRALLRAVWREGNIAAAARSVGLDPANAHRHLRTAERRHGVSLVDARHGGRGGRNARLTRQAKRLLDLRMLRGIAGAFDATEGVTPVRIGARTLAVAGRLTPGPVALRVPPESVILERASAKDAASPRNRVPMRVDAIRERDEGTFVVALVAGALRLDSLVVRGAVRDLRLRPGSRVVAVIKAVAIEAE